MRQVIQPEWRAWFCSFEMCGQGAMGDAGCASQYKWRKIPLALIDDSLCCANLPVTARRLG
jgi:hypothetical protein